MKISRSPENVEENTSSDGGAVERWAPEELGAATATSPAATQKNMRIEASDNRPAD
jgi:hypothetical protein